MIRLGLDQNKWERDRSPQNLHKLAKKSSTVSEDSLTPNVHKVAKSRVIKDKGGSVHFGWPSDYDGWSWLRGGRPSSFCGIYLEAF